MTHRSPSAHLRLRRRARRLRARRAPARVQSGVLRGRAARGLVGGGVRRAAPDRRREGARRVGAHTRALLRCTLACPVTPTRCGTGSPLSMRGRPRSSARSCGPGRVTARPGVVRLVDEAAVAGGREWPSRRPRPRSRCAQSSTTRSGQSAPHAAPYSRATSWRRRSPTPRSTSSRSSSWRGPRRRHRDRRLSKRAAGGHGRWASLRDHGLELHA